MWMTPYDSQFCAGETWPQVRVCMQPKKADRLPFWKDTGPAELLLALYTGFGLTVIQSLRILYSQQRGLF